MVPRSGPKCPRKPYYTLLSPCLIYCMIFEEKYFSCYILLTDQISLSGFLFFFFFLSGFSITTIHESQDCRGRGRAFLTPHYHFHPLLRHLEISRAITAESSPLHIASPRTRTGNLWFPSASR